MTWTVHNEEGRTATVTKADFREDGAERWSITTKDRDGKVVSEASGKNVRK